jgi:hypothetical protein
VLVAKDALVFFCLSVVLSAFSFSRTGLLKSSIIYPTSFHTMNVYDVVFTLLVSLCGLLTWRQYHVGEEPEVKALTQPSPTPNAKAEASQFTRLFLTVYCLVMGSDWLQGILAMQFSFK